MSDWQDNGEQSGGRPKLWTALIALLAFVLAGVVLGPGLISRTAAPERSAAAPLPAVEPVEFAPSVAAAAQPVEPLQDSVFEPGTFDCMIQPSEVVDLGSAIDGLIEEIHVDRGDYVERGQTVARLESHVEEAALRVAEANAERQGMLESSKASLELGRKRRARAQELFASNSLSLDLRQTIETEERLAAAKLKEAKEDKALAALRLEQARATLARRTIRSPVSGFVVERSMTPGEVVEEDTILRIAQVDPLKVEVILPVSLYGKIVPGAQATLTPEAPLDEPRVAEVALVDPVIDGASATFGAQLLLANPGNALPAGLRCRVRFADAP